MRLSKDSRPFNWLPRVSFRFMEGHFNNSINRIRRLLPWLGKSTRLFPSFSESAAEPVLGMSQVRHFLSTTGIFSEFPQIGIGTGNEKVRRWIPGFIRMLSEFPRISS